MTERESLLAKALADLKREYEDMMHSEFATSSNSKPWAKVEAWQQAEAALHADDVPVSACETAMRGGEGQALLKFRLRAAAILCETRGHAGYRPCDFCLNVTLFEPTHGQVNPTAAAPAMKRDQLDTQRQAESNGDRIGELIARWQHIAEHGQGTPVTDDFKFRCAMERCAAELDRATAATPTEPPKERDEE